MLKPRLALVLASSLPLTCALAAVPRMQSVEVQMLDRSPGKVAAQQDPKKGRLALLAQVVALQHTRAKDVARTVSRSLKLDRKRTDLVVIPHPDANALLLRGSKARISQALDEIARVDIQPAFEGNQAITKVVIIENGSATEIARTLNKFFNTQATDDLRIEPHAPNNMVLLRGTKNRVIDALDLIARLDMKPAARQAKPKWVILEHTRAAEVAATLIRFLDLASNTGPNRGLMIDADKGRNAIILRGTVEQTKQAIELIARIDWAAGKKPASKKPEKANKVR